MSNAALQALQTQFMITFTPTTADRLLQLRH